MNKTFLSKDWVQKVREFIEFGNTRGVQGFSGLAEVEPPLSEVELAEMCKVLPVALPETLRQFLVTGSRSCRFRYEWKLVGMSPDLLAAAGLSGERVVGGGDLCRCSSFLENLEDCKAWATETWIADEKEEFCLWRDSLPIMSLRNGDYLAVQTTGDPDPPVVYLCHDDMSRIIAASLSGFLQAWAEIFYVGPELWILGDFLDQSTGFLDAKCARAQDLRVLFRRGFSL